VGGYFALDIFGASLRCMTGSEVIYLYIYAIGFGSITGFTLGALLYWKK